MPTDSRGVSPSRRRLATCAWTGAGLSELINCYSDYYDDAIVYYIQFYLYIVVFDRRRVVSAGLCADDRSVEDRSFDTDHACAFGLHPEVEWLGVLSGVWLVVS
jgi:hypothetical protein